MRRTLSAGDFVRCNFPFHPEIDEPGPSPHIVYVLATGTSNGYDLAVCGYTTSRMHFSDPLPAGVKIFDRTAAAALNQKPFTLDMRTVGFLPIQPEYFPGLPDPKVLATAGRSLKRELFELFKAAQARGLVTLVGPLRPR